MKEFVKIDATTFLMLKSPPPDLPAQKPPMSPLDMYDDTGMSFMQIPCHVIHGHDATVMARHPVFRHDMSYMDMPWSWHFMPCSHLMWPWHDKLHMKQVMLPTHFQPFISWRLVSNSFRFRRAGRLSILAMKMWNGGIYNGIEHCHIFGFFSLQQLFLDSFPHILER